MTPLDEKTKREHGHVGRAQEFMEKAWNAVVAKDYPSARTWLDHADECLIEAEKAKAAKVIPIRGPKGRGM